MANGSINNPSNVYHLEINFDEKERAELVKKYLNQFDIKAKVVAKSNYYTVYMKNGDDISNFLAFIDANKSVLKFEDIIMICDLISIIKDLIN